MIKVIDDRSDSVYNYENGHHWDVDIEKMLHVLDEDEKIIGTHFSWSCVQWKDKS